MTSGQTVAWLKTHIEGGKAHVVLHAKGRAMAQCLVYDVILTKR